MDSYSLKKKKKRINKQRDGTKRYGLEVDIKTRCNVIVWCHISLCIKKNLTRLTEHSGTEILSVN